MATELASIESKMKIILNGLPVVYPMSGVGRYTLEIGKALEDLVGSGNILWFGRNGSAQRDWDSNHEDPVFTNRIQHHLRKGLRGVPGLKTLVRIWRNNQFRTYIRKNKPALYHETNYTPFRFEEGPTVLTLYDLSFIRHPEWHPKDRVKYFEKYCVRQLSKVEAIITISEFSKKEIVNLLGINPNKICVTPLGVDGEFTPRGKRMEGFPDAYILFLGNLEPRKNLVTLLAAYRSLPNNLRKRFPLVIAGASGWNTNKIEKALHLFQKNEKPILTGYVSQHRLPDLYRGASLFVYPSLYEGFGLPVIEAMACGIPVITSNTSSLPEVVGDAGMMVDPDRVEELTESMNLALSDEQLLKEMRRKGLNRAKMFSWEKCAQETLNVYQEVLGKHLSSKGDTWKNA